MKEEGLRGHIPSHQVFSHAAEFESALVEAAAQGAILLAATGRLARRILHRFRMERIKEKVPAWETPAVYSFNRWVQSTFDSLWADSLLLTRVGALSLWHEAVRMVEPLDGLDLTPSLYLELQNAFDLLARHGETPAATRSGETLPAWRRTVSTHYLRLLQERHLVSWAGVLAEVEKAVAGGRVKLPGKTIFAGFDELYPAEEDLLQAVGRRTEVTFLSASNEETTGEAKVRVYGTPEQECRAVCAEVLTAWNKGEKRLGIVLLDPAYFGLLKRQLEELTDREVKPSDALRYNLAMGTPLSEHPLFQTAMIPLRLIDEPAPDLLLSSLLSSPYVKGERNDWAEGVRSVLWNRETLGGLRDAIFRLKVKGFPVAAMEGLHAAQGKSLRWWLESLEMIWEGLNFPVCRCETDTLARKHLTSIVEDLKREVGRIEVGCGEVRAWLGIVSAGVEVVEKTPETTGIQVLNPVESRGLAFDRLWVVGTHGRVLPGPVQELPLLDADERRRIRGGTTESTWDFAQRNLSCLLASAPAIGFSRAAGDGDEKPFLPSPLIRDECDEQEGYEVIDLWKDPPAAWLRARWLREGLTGLSDRMACEREIQPGRVDVLLPSVLRITTLEKLLSCPFKFFAEHHLELEPLRGPEMGIPPTERGELIHEILREFTRGLTTAAPDWPMDGSAALRFLRETAAEVLATKSDDLFWKVEGLRLLGDETSPGLLSSWLNVERERAVQGWRFEVAEEAFAGLCIGDAGVALSGRVDRIDSHPACGIALWDYKTGDPPSSHEVFKEMVAPQLPAYLLALKRNLLRRIKPGGGEVVAGYIVLKKESEVKIEPLKDDAYWQDFLARWEGAVEARIKGPQGGVYAPDPLPSPGRGRKKGACSFCDFGNLCNYLDLIAGEHGKDGEGEEGS